MRNIKTDHLKTTKLYDWTSVKDKLHRSNGRPGFNDGQIWWCAIGENIGVEENGKSAKYSRPVLIIKRLNADSFVCVPLTSVPQSGERFYSFTFNGQLETAVLSQVRTLSVSRLYNRIGTIPSNTRVAITEALIKMIQ
ncbi:type II toxin-antitoxin system PemK/MazF family toxin [Candidatus Saccharibacteria bacterium]|nr:type II toxin-antitoxin system PemK/MazF family toxin [Candidatus Saccharibacteria bacterium]